MPIVIIGMNHRTAPVELRERLAVPADRLAEAMRRARAESSSLTEVAALSTCNRFEVYAVVEDVADAARAFDAIARHVDAFSLHEVQPYLYTHVDGEAVRHLYRVASGLDSMVLGESQILGQVVDAYELAQQAQTVGAVLSRLFQQAIHTGKRVRSETPIGRAAASVGSAAVHLLRREVPDLTQRRALIVGAGKMARTAARYLRDLGATQLAVVNRTAERAVRLAEDVGADVYTWGLLRVALRWADVAIVATGASAPIIDEPLLREARRVRQKDTLVIVDIGVPRNVVPDVAAMPGVRLFDIDDLKHVMDEGLAQRRQAIPAAEAIIEQQVEEFTRWLHARSIAPTIAALYEQAEDVRQQVVKRTLRRLPKDADPATVAEEVSRYLVEKLLQVPARNLYALAREGRLNGHEKVLQEMFEIRRLQVKG